VDNCQHTFSHTNLTKTKLIRPKLT
jgi:hypothetical protein